MCRERDDIVAVCDSQENPPRTPRSGMINSLDVFGSWPKLLHHYHRLDAANHEQGYVMLLSKPISGPGSLLKRWLRCG